MPITRQTSKSKNLTTIMATGEITVAEIFEIVKSFKSQPPAKNILWDFSEANPTDSFNDTDMKRIASLAKSNLGSRPNCKTAFVATDNLQFGLTRMYMTYLEFQDITHETQVFRTLDKANQWLEESG